MIGRPDRSADGSDDDSRESDGSAIGWHPVSAMREALSGAAGTVCGGM